jgi:hypothetical protein
MHESHSVKMEKCMDSSLSMLASREDDRERAIRPGELSCVAQLELQHTALDGLSVALGG